MFNLEPQTIAWRNQMLAARPSPGALDELESHLRDDIEQQLRSGVDVQLAFETAVQRLGSSALLNSEFNKISPIPKSHWLAHVTLFAVAGLLVALHIWTGDGLREFSLIYCLLACLALPLFSGSQPLGDSRLPRRWFQTMLVGQISISIGGAWIIWSPVSPVFGLIFALFSCAFFIRQLRRLSRVTLFPAEN